MYLEDIFTLHENEKELLVGLNSWLPDSITDAHFHCWLNANADEIINNSARVPGQTFQYFPWELHRKMLDCLFEHRLYKCVAFGMPFIQERRNNEYILRLHNSGLADIIPVFTDTRMTDSMCIKQSLGKSFAALKGYASQAQKANQVTKIIDFSPREILKIADSLSSTIVLHLPGDIFRSLEELLGLAHAYPHVSFIVAHMGNMYVHKTEVATVYAAVAEYSNIFLDTAMVADEKIIAEGIVALGSNRVIFGSDAPFSYIRGRHVLIDDMVRFQSQLLFNWVDPIDYKEYEEEVKDFRLMHINILLAIKEAFCLVGLNGDEAKKNVFTENANRILRRRP